MQAGELRHRITLQRLERRTDENNVSGATFYDLKTVWAKVNGLFGKEYWTAKEYGAENTVVFTIRRNACRDLSVRDRIMFRGRIYNILSIDNALFRDALLHIKAVAEEAERQTGYDDAAREGGSWHGGWV